MDKLIYKYYEPKTPLVISKDKWHSAVILLTALFGAGIICLFSSCRVITVPAHASEIINVEKLATAIYYAEGGSHTNHPYGILAHYKTTTPRQACLNTIKSAIRRYEKTNQRMDFVKFLSLTYCPIGAKNDPAGLNANWYTNVSRIYARLI